MQDSAVLPTMLRKWVWFNLVCFSSLCMFDVNKQGFACQGNEFSHYMLLTSFFILNKFVFSIQYLWSWSWSAGFTICRTTEIKKHTFYPYVHSFSNAPNKQSILQAISVPDVSPSDLPLGSDFSLVAGQSSLKAWSRPSILSLPARGLCRPFPRWFRGDFW